MRTLFSALAIAAAAFTALPAAAAGLTNEKSQIENLTAANVSEILTELGAQEVQSNEKNGRILITFKDGSIPYNVGIICDSLGCTSLQLLMAMSTSSKKYPLDILNAANRETPIVQILQYDSDTLFISRVTFTDGGVSKKNIAVNIGSFVGEVHRTLKFLTTQVVAGYQPGGSSQFQPVGMATDQLRPAVLSPEDALKAMDKVAGRKGQSFKN